MSRLFRRRRQFRIRRCGCGEERIGARWIRIHWCPRHDPLDGWPELFEFTAGDC